MVPRPLSIVIAAQVVLFVPLAVLRTADADEGFYLLASRLVFEGRLPYVDFLFTQMPLLPYVYGAWMKVFGFNWYAARLLSALLATALGTLIFLYVERTLQNRALAWIGLFLYVTSAFTLAWNTVAMTYALSGLLLFAAFTALELRWNTMLSGFLLGLAVDTRLLIAAAIPAFIIGLLVGWQNRKHTALGLTGLAIGLLPTALFFAIDPNAFLFGNLGFHALRNGTGLIANWPQKAAMLLELLDIHSSGGETITFQVPLLLALNAFYVVLGVHRQVWPTLALVFTVFLGVALFLPTPTYTQYFVIVLPFAIVTSLGALEYLHEQIRRPAAHVALGVFLGAYALVVPVVFYRYVSWLGPIVPGLLQADVRAWSLPSIREMSGRIEQWSQPGDVVMAWWPGYLFETHVAPAAGTENHGWMEINTPLTLARPSIATHQSVSAALGRVEPRLVVIGVITPPDDADVARASGYTRIDAVAGAELLKHS